MPGRALHAELNAVRALVSHGLSEVSTAGDVGQFWIRSACARLTAADAVLTEAAGVVALPVQVLALSTVSFAAVFLSASIGGLWAAGVMIVLGAAAAPWVARRVRIAIGRHRLARVGTPPVLGHTPRLPGLIIVPETLLHARVRLVSATLRHVGTRRWSTPSLIFAARTDPVVRRLAEADLLLCQAIDCLERYLDDMAKG